MKPKQSPARARLTPSELQARDAKRSIGDEMLQAVKHAKAMAKDKTRPAVAEQPERQRAK